MAAVTHKDCRKRLDQHPDSRNAYAALALGGWLVWQDFNSPVPWVKVREAIERLSFPEPVVHVEGTEVAYLRKQAALPSPRTNGAHSGPVNLWASHPAQPGGAGHGARRPRRSRAAVAPDTGRMPRRHRGIQAFEWIHRETVKSITLG